MENEDHDNSELSEIISNADDHLTIAKAGDRIYVMSTFDTEVEVIDALIAALSLVRGHSDSMQVTEADLSADRIIH